MALGSTRSTRRRWSWLLSLGLLFAFAQMAANAHAISHFGKDGNGSREGALVHAQCELCLIGAAIGGAAPLPEPPSLRHPLLGVDEPGYDFGRRWARHQRCSLFAFIMQLLLRQFLKV